MRSIDYFDKVANRHPERMALIASETHYTYGELQALSHKVAGAMLGAGLKHQEPAAILSPNDGAVLVSLLGLWRAGAVWIPVNTRNALDANIAYLNYVRPVWFFYHSSLAAEADEVRAAVPSIRHVICLDREGDDHPSLATFMSTFGEKEIVDWGDASGNPDELVAIIATGGTTGPAKGVRILNRSWSQMLETIVNEMQSDLPPVCLATAPLSHAAGPFATAALAMGATIVVLPGFDAEGVMAAITEHRVTHMFLPPTALYSMLSHPRVDDFDYSSLRYFLLAGSPVSPDKLKQAVAVFGPCMCQSYGQTECHLIATWLPPDVVAAAAGGDHPERLASCGRASYSVRIEIMDDDGRLLADDDVGEIVARGGLVGGGYFEMPEATEEARLHGWHHTGDVAKRDADGFFYIVDRKKDMIVSGGFNVFSAEVEATVMELAEVSECAVVGTPHEKWGEAVTAIVVLKPGATVSDEQIIAHCKARIGSVKAPKSVHFRGEIPRTGAGKFDKKTIRAEFWKGTGRNVH